MKAVDTGPQSKERDPHLQLLGASRRHMMMMPAKTWVDSGQGPTWDPALPGRG